MLNTIRIFETDRLILSKFSLDDAPFILKMQNDPD